MDLKNVIAAARARITPNPVFTAGNRSARRHPPRTTSTGRRARRSRGARRRVASRCAEPQ